MRRVRPSLLPYALWAGFALAIVASGVVLLRACGLGALAWNFCPAADEVAPELIAESERGAALGAQVRQLELDVLRNRLACSAEAPPKPPLELPNSPDPVQPQQTAARKSEPPLPAKRWDDKDLTLLKGCWQLGKETQTRLRQGNKTEVCNVKAGTICFGEDGTGERQQEALCKSGSGFTCKAPVTATFGNDKTLRTKQPQVTCTPPSISWFGDPNALTCVRVDDKHANCRDGTGFTYEFRRKEGA